MTKTPEQAKTAKRQATRKDYFDFLDKRIPELHKAGVDGVFARRQADYEWAKR